METITFTNLGHKNIRIEDYAFREASKLRAVHNLKRPTYIGLDAFRGCSRLEVFAFPISLNEVEAGAFAETGLRTIELELYDYNLIHHETFKDCNQLQAVFITGKLKSIDASAFEGCDALKVIFLEKPTMLAFLTKELAKVAVPLSQDNNEDDDIDDNNEDD